ncbi:hypothetical protein VULLAG_LOCUS21048 [Vulpes lagopus]
MAEWSKAPDSSSASSKEGSGLRMEAWVRIPLLTRPFCPPPISAVLLCLLLFLLRPRSRALGRLSLSFPASVTVTGDHVPPAPSVHRRRLPGRAWIRDVDAGTREPHSRSPSRGPAPAPQKSKGPERRWEGR